MPMSTSLCIAAVSSALGSSWEKKWSSNGLTVGLPPSALARPGWLNGTSQRYWAAVPSTYPGPKLVGVIDGNEPLLKRADRNLLAGLRMLRQFCARASSASASVESPCALAELDRAASA